MIDTNVQVDGHKYEPKQVENANACEPEASIRYTILDKTKVSVKRRRQKKSRTIVSYKKTAT